MPTKLFNGSLLFLIPLEKFLAITATSPTHLKLLTLDRQAALLHLQVKEEDILVYI